MSHCTNINHPQIQEWAKRFKTTPETIGAMVSLWQQQNNDLEEFPSNLWIENQINYFNNTKYTKPGVEELFDSNPELANQVYEALGFKQNKIDLKPYALDVWGKVPNQRGDNRFVDKEQYSVKINTENKGIDVRLTVYFDKDTNTAFVSNIENFENEVTHKDKKGLGKKAFIEANKLIISKGFVPVIDNLVSGFGYDMLSKLEKEGFLVKNLDKIKGETNYENIKYKESPFSFTDKIYQDQITPQQKQQALQLYSQYLDTISNIKPGVSELFESNPELANAIYEALGFEIPTTKLQGKEFEYGEPRFFDVVEKLTSGERANLPSSILINKLLKGEYLPEIKESQIILGLSEAGIWRPNIKKIEASGENKSTLAKKIGHELLHSVTNNIILSYQNLKGVLDFNDKYYKDFIKQGYVKPVDLSKSQVEALDNLVRIRNKVVSYVEQNKDKIQKQDRGFGTYDYFIRTNYTESETDLHEFISEVFTNPELINILKEIPTEGKKSNLFKDFVDAIAKILGFTNTSILEDIIAYSEEAFFQQPQITPQQKQQATSLFSEFLDVYLQDYEQVEKILKEENIIEKDCTGGGKLKAEKGLQTNFTKGGEWKIYEIFEGKSHKQGGIDINIKNNQISFTNKNGSIKAKYGLVISKDN